ncbi:unnamed protein product [Chondrus crispus]|uniref:Uncharacterized protein n=1 Tax=Chondrus crispus TaxID=2769 RepID=R7Q956_CHOCR|nr:unnamed protein product [Chondrus crispus]CDF35052.1 unnamed protein product [Chondrus crispus]|eukprot:XP_005714871.1 unnamed protein product [Chondrus crispus]
MALICRYRCSRNNMSIALTGSQQTIIQTVSRLSCLCQCGDKPPTTNAKDLRGEARRIAQHLAKARVQDATQVPKNSSKRKKPPISSLQFAAELVLGAVHDAVEVGSETARGPK